MALTEQQKRELQIAQSRVTQGTASDTDKANLAYAQKTFGYTPGKEVFQDTYGRPPQSSAEAMAIKEFDDRQQSGLPTSASATPPPATFNATTGMLQGGQPVKSGLEGDLESARQGVESYSQPNSFLSAVKTYLKLKNPQVEQQKIGESGIFQKAGLTGYASLLSSLSANQQSIQKQGQNLAAVLNSLSNVYFEQGQLQLSKYKDLQSRHDKIISDLTEMQKEQQEWQRKNYLLEQADKSERDLLKYQLELEKEQYLYEQQNKSYAPTGGGGGSGISGQGTEGLSERAKAVYENPSLLANYTPTQRGHILDEIAKAGLDTQRLTVPGINSGQRDNIALYDDLQREADNSLNLLNSGLDTGPVASTIKKGQALFGGAQEFTVYRSSIDNMSSQLLKLRSGAAVTPQEFERIKGFIPSPNDDEKTAKTKILRFNDEIRKSQENYIARTTQTPYQIQQSINPSDGLVDDAAYQEYLKMIGQ